MRNNQPPIIVTILQCILYLIALPIILIILIEKLIRKHKENVILNEQYKDIKNKKDSSK